MIHFQAYMPAFSLKRLQHRCFLEKFLKTAYFCRTPQSSLYLFQILCDDRIFWKSLGTKLTFFIFFVPLFCFLHGCFHTKIFSKCKFRTHYNVGSSTTLIESLKFRNNSRITVSYPRNLLWKVWIWVFWILCFVIISL